MRARVRQQEHYIRDTLFPIVVALVIGILAGVGAVVFRFLIEAGQDLIWKAGDTFTQQVHATPLPWKFLIPVIAGLAAGPVITYIAPELKGPGVPEVMRALALRAGRIRHRVTALKTFVTAMLLSAGASVGREGPIVQIGASIGSSITQLLNLDHRYRRLAVSCGAAAGIAATFQAPMAGTLFAVEILLFDLEVASLSNIVIAAITGTVTSKLLVGNFHVFNVECFRLIHPAELILYFLLGIFAGFISLAMIHMVSGIPQILKKIRIPAVVHPAFGGIAAGLAAIFIPQVTGVGYDSVHAALSGNIALKSALVLLAAKIIVTSCCLGSGMSGGIFAPSLFAGAMLGCAAGHIAEIFWPVQACAPSNYALIGMGALVSGTTLAPITAIMTIFEFTYTYQVILPLMAACIPAVLVVKLFHGHSIYETKLLKEGITLSRGHGVNRLREFLVKQLMTTNFETVHIDTPATEVAAMMKKSHYPHFVVVDNRGNLAGMLTLRDMVGLITGDQEGSQAETQVGSEIRKLKASDIMTPEPVTVRESDSLETAFHLFARHHISSMPVVDDNNNRKVKGLIKKAELLNAYDEHILRAGVL